MLVCDEKSTFFSVMEILLRYDWVQMGRHYSFAITMLWTRVLICLQPTRSSLNSLLPKAWSIPPTYKHCTVHLEPSPLTTLYHTQLSLNHFCDVEFAIPSDPSCTKIYHSSTDTFSSPCQGLGHVQQKEMFTCNRFNEGSS